MRRIEKAVATAANEHKFIVETLATPLQQAEQVKALRGELAGTHGAVQELNRTMNDMHETTREDLVKLARAATPRTTTGQSPWHISKRWQRFKKIVEKGPECMLEIGANARPAPNVLP